MRKFTLLTLLLFFLSSMGLYAQKTVSGTVTNAVDGSAIPGVSVLIKGTQKGTVSDLDGKYKLEVPDDKTVLVFSFIGMESQEIVVGSQTTIDVKMKTAATNIKGVEITALGLTRIKDKSASSSTKVTGTEITRSGESGVISSMAGKSSGLLIIKNNGDPGAGSYIQIRGQSTISNSVQPLIVVDGVPINNSSIGGGVDGVAQQSRFNDINPDDIESVEVLKGAAAAAVWGTRAANGVIIVTTKKGKLTQGGKNVSVDFHSNFSWDMINREYAKQDVFGQGSGGKWKANTGGSWGDKIADRSGTDTLYSDPKDPKYQGYFLGDKTGNKYYAIDYKGDKTVYNSSNRDQVFRTGFTSDIGVGVTIANKNSRLYMSLSDWNQKGVIKGNSDYRRTGFRANFESKLSPSVDLKINTYYAKINSNRIQQGSNLNGLYLGYLRTAPDFDNTDYIGTYYDASGVAHFSAHRSYRRYLGDKAPTYNNPGWTMYQQVNTTRVDRFIINPEMNIMLAKNSRLTFRYGIDYSGDKRITMFPYNSAGSNSAGDFSDDNITQLYTSTDLFAQTSHKLTENINFNWILGFQYNKRNYNYLGGNISNFRYTEIPVYIFSNAPNDSKTPFRSESSVTTAGSYLVADFDLYNQVFVELTGRSEIASTYKDPIFYPSASVAWDFSKMTGTNNAFSFGKLRLTYGTVGVQPPPYITSTQYVSAYVGSGWGPHLDGSYYGTPIVESGTQGNQDIKPEKKTEIEIGTDLRFVKDRIGVAFTYYTNKTDGAIFPVKVAASTGYNSKWDNAAVISNKGIELDIDGAIVKRKDFNISAYLNFTHNKNKVEDLKGTESIFLAGFTGTSSRAVEGKPLGALWGGRWLRDGDGKMVLDANGFPKQDPEEGVIGDPNPDWFGGLGMTFEYKGIKLSFLFQHSHGGDMWAGTWGVLNYFGIDPETANEVTLTKDVKNYSGKTIASGTTVRGNLKDFGGGEVLLDQSWYTSLGGGFGPVAEQFIIDATWTRLREINISYSLPKSFVSKLNLTNIEIGLSGQNLLLWTNFPGVDPDLNLTGTSNGRGLDYFTNPGVKSFLVNFRVQF